MPKDYDSSKFAILREEARKAFLADSAYAVAIARTASALVARRESRANLAELAAQA